MKENRRHPHCVCQGRIGTLDHYKPLLIKTIWLTETHTVSTGIGRTQMQVAWSNWWSSMYLYLFINIVHSNARLYYSLTDASLLLFLLIRRDSFDNTRDTTLQDTRIWQYRFKGRIIRGIRRYERDTMIWYKEHYDSMNTTILGIRQYMRDVQTNRIPWYEEWDDTMAWGRWCTTSRTT